MQVVDSGAGTSVCLPLCQAHIARLGEQLVGPLSPCVLHYLKGGTQILGLPWCHLLAENASERSLQRLLAVWYASSGALLQIQPYDALTLQHLIFLTWHDGSFVLFGNEEHEAFGPVNGSAYNWVLGRRWPDGRWQILVSLPFNQLRRPYLSPDGDKVAFFADARRLLVFNLVTGQLNTFCISNTNPVVQ